MVVLLYIVLDWYSVFSIFLIISLVLLVLAQKFDKNLTNEIKKYDTMPFIQKCWCVFSFIVNLLFRLFSPCHRAIDRNVNKNKEFIKNAMMKGFFESSMSSFDISTVFNNIDMSNNQLHCNAQDIHDMKLKQLTDENMKNMNDIEEFLKNMDKKNI